MPIQKALTAAQQKLRRNATRRECPVHGFQRHGREAEELRRGVQRIIEEFDCEEGVADRRDLCAVLQALLDNTDARDSLAFMERRAGRSGGLGR